MNIDLVNTIVSGKLDIDKEEVGFVNSMYWEMINKHMLSYNPRPVNIEQICVLYPNKYHIKTEILTAISKLRALRTSEKFREGSQKTIVYTRQLHDIIKNLLKIRRHHKYTN